MEYGRCELDDDEGYRWMLGGHVPEDISPSLFSLPQFFVFLFFSVSIFSGAKLHILCVHIPVKKISGEIEYCVSGARPPTCSESSDERT